jgi:predicted metal-dependent hydrolase
MESAAEAHFGGGLALFNRGCFFECHEEWEEVWKRSAGEEKSFYQGLIQAAVALLHARRGNLRGAASIYAKACARLDVFPADYMGIALDKFREELDVFFTAALAGRPLPAAPQITRHAS